VTGLLPGDYLAVAVEYLADGAALDPETLQKLRSLATPARITELGKQSLDLQLKVLR
jgi:hypothetical protein